MPIPNARKPSGTTLPYGRTVTRTCGWIAIRGAGCRGPRLRNRGCEARGAGCEPALLEVLLVVVLGLPERLGVLDLRHDRLRQPGLDAVARGFGGRALLLVVHEDRGAVLLADVGSLAVQLRRVVLRPED